MYNKKNVRKYQRKNKKYSKGPSKNFAKMVKRVLFKNSESKFIDTTTSVANLLNTGDTSFFSDLCPSISKGTTENTRIGDQIYQRGIKLNWLITSLLSHSIRILIVKINNYSTSVGTDFDYTQVGIIGQLPRDVIDYHYKVLYDKTYNLDPDYKGSVRGSLYLKLNIPRQFNDTNDVNSSNMVRMFVYTTNTTPSSVSMDLNSRYFYKDI